MSNIAAGTTSTTALVATADTTGALVFQTGASATTAMTISSTQTVSFTNLLNYYTASLGADVALNNTANYFDGPSVAQGTSGTWFVSGTVTVKDSSAAEVIAKLWDGTTVIDSGGVYMTTGNGEGLIALSGVITSPAGNLRISCRDTVNTTGLIKYNQTGNSKDSTITAIRIA
jgi:myosin-crossreactive antigen